MARYAFGVERRIYLNDASETEVAGAVNELVDQAESINNAAANQFWYMREHAVSEEDVV